MAADARDPDLAPFVGDVHLGDSFVIARPSRGVASLGYLTAMERDEAGRTGLKLLTPESLGLLELSRDAASESELWARILDRALGAAGLEPGRVGLAGRFPAGTVHAACSRLAEAGWRFEAAHELLRALRKSKTEEELASIRRTAAATVTAFRATASLLADSGRGEGGLELGNEPLTAGRLRAEIRSVFADRGLEQPHGNIVAGGRDAAVPHTQGASDRQLRPHESIVVDLYPKGRLFADCTRTFCVGSVPPELEQAHRAVLAALKRAQAAVRPGVAGWDLQLEVCESLGEVGYATPLSDPETTRGYVHGLGHGVGLELHEYPTFRKDRDEAGLLAEGDVFTPEPGLYDPQAGYGVRLEDLCDLGGTGLEILTDLPYALDPRAWT